MEWSRLNWAMRRGEEEWKTERKSRGHMDQERFRSAAGQDPREHIAKMAEVSGQEKLWGGKQKPSSRAGEV